MRTRWWLLAAVLFTVGLMPGCGGDDGKDNPFEGRWISQTGTVIVFGGSTWSDSDGDTGDYTFLEQPVPSAEVDKYIMVYTVTLTGEGPTETYRASFLDKNTVDFCELSPTGAIGACAQLNRDKPVVSNP